MVRALSKGLNSTINQMLRLYEANLFIERPISRVIFGPSGESVDESGGPPVPTMPEMPLDGDDSSSNNSIGLARLQAGPSDGLKSAIFDRATLEILKLYDKTSQYFEKLGVDVNPYDLIAAQLGGGKEGGGLSSKLQDSEGNEIKKYRFNSMLAFFQNNSLQKFDLYTGKEVEEKKKQKNGQIIRLNNER